MAPADPLAAFSPATATWFGEVFAAPTAAQRGAWEAVSAGDNALVIAPTGSGKTLAAFLWALDDLTRSGPVPAKERCRVLYVSPLKALAVDVERNLRAPLTGITQTAVRIGQTPPTITVGVRSGDTSAADRRAIVSRPPDILITTPESLFLMLTSAARETLRHVRTVIVDEVHALAGTKRGAHLALSLERLQALTSGVRTYGRSRRDRSSGSACRRPCVPPSGSHASSAAPSGADHRPACGEVVGSPGRRPRRGHERAGVDRVRAGTDPRRRRPAADPALDLAARGEQDPRPDRRRTARRSCSPTHGDWPSDSPRISTSSTPNALGEPRDEFPPPAEVMAQSGASAGHDGSRTPVIARAHHGSVSKEQRAQIEADLKSGLLPCVVATSSLELGIDMGAVDIVVQVEAPPSVASGLQRVGRAGHQVGATSRGVFFPNHRGDLVESAVVVERMRQGAIEEVAELRNPLDVLAQQVVAAVAMEESSTDRVVRAVPAGGAVCRPAAQRVRRGARHAERPLPVGGLRRASAHGWCGSATLASSRPGPERSGSPSPQVAPFPTAVCSASFWSARAPRRASTRPVAGSANSTRRWCTRPGSGTSSRSARRAGGWSRSPTTRCSSPPHPGSPGRLPFWKGDSPARPVELGVAFGEFVRGVAALAPDRALSRLAEAGLDTFAATNLVSYLGEQAAVGALPTDTTIVFERFRDELGDWRVCVHTPLGSSVLAPWALAIERSARERYGMEVQATATNDGIVLRIPDTESNPPSAELLVVEPDELEAIVTEEVGGSALFAARFRECAARALLLPQARPEGPDPALAAADAFRTAVDRCCALPRVPDRARDDARVPQRRLRPGRAPRPAAPDRGPVGGDRRGRDHRAVAVRQVAVVRLRRLVRVRGRRPAGREEGRSARPGRHPARRAAGQGRPQAAAGSGSHRRDGGRPAGAEP